MDQSQNPDNLLALLSFELSLFGRNLYVFLRGLLQRFSMVKNHFVTSCLANMMHNFDAAYWYNYNMVSKDSRRTALVQRNVMHLSKNSMEWPQLPSASFVRTTPLRVQTSSLLLWNIINNLLGRLSGNLSRFRLSIGVVMLVVCLVRSNSRM